MKTTFKFLLFVSFALLENAFGRGTVQLSCDMKPLEQSGLSSEFYATPVAFEQRKLTGIFLELTEVGYASTPTLSKLTIVYQKRAPKSLLNQENFEVTPVSKALSNRIDIPFFSDYFGSQEARFTWNPKAEISWDEKGHYTAKVPGWLLFIEATDPYHHESFEQSLNCN